MSRLPSRRLLLKHAGAGVIGSAALSQLAWGRVHGAGDRLVLGLIGCGGMGTNLLQSFAGMKDVAIAYVCDVDADRARGGLRLAERVGGHKPQIAEDLRKVLDDRSVDAVVIATPDHWHAPATLLACQAGKHVYVEKPCAHNIREGRLMIEAGQRYHQVIQTGTQSRSVPHVIEAMQKLREGVIGDVLAAKAWNSQLRANIKHVAPSEPPKDLNYDLWVGPAPMRPYQSNMIPSHWRWFFAFGCGDIGNDGVHELDIARWGLGVDGHPSTITAAGSKFFFDDDQQFPDTHYVIYEYPGDGQLGHKRQLVYEQRTWSPYVQEGYENGNAFYGTKGMMIFGKKEGWQVFGPQNKPGPAMTDGKFDSTPHHRDFLDAIRKNRHPNADIQIGHHAATLAHLGNIAARLGRTIHFDSQKELVVGDEEANRLTRRTYRQGHWAVPAEGRPTAAATASALPVIKNKFRVAVIGRTGRGDYGHGLDVVWKDISQAEVVAVADEDEQGRNAAAKRLGAAHAYADYREMLEKEKPQIVSVAPRWLDCHHDMVLACAEAGCHMFLEKPVARSLAEADEMVEACRKRNLKVVVAHQARYSPRLPHVLDLIRDGRLGDLLELRARGKEDQRGGGEDLMVLGTHMMDLMRLLAGNPTWCSARVFEKGRPLNKDGVRDGDEGIGPLAGDELEATFGFASPTLGYFATHRARHGVNDRFGLRVYGSKGILTIGTGTFPPIYFTEDPAWAPGQSKAHWIEITSAGLGEPEPAPDTSPQTPGNILIAQDLLAAIEADRQPKGSIEDGRAALEMILAVYESHRVNAPVALPLKNRRHPLTML